MKRYHRLRVAHFHQDRWLADTVLGACIVNWRVSENLVRSKWKEKKKATLGISTSDERAFLETAFSTAVKTSKNDMTAFGRRVSSSHKLIFMQLNELTFQKT
jgi:hypothetical protein